MSALAERTTVRCPGCGMESDEPELLLSGRDRLTGAPGEFEVVGCGGCGLAFTEPRLGPDDFATYYPEEYSAYVPRALERGRISPGLLLDRVRLETVIRYGPYREIWKRGPSRILDVGCSTGDIGSILVEHGWDACGVEPSEAAAAHARERGIDVHNGMLDDAPWDDASFDAVMFNHSLEHIDDPADALARAARLVKPGGVVAIAVPNFGSWHRRRFGSAWFQLDLPRHLQHFDRDSLSALVRAAGLRPTVISAASMRPSLLGSLQYVRYGGMRHQGRGFQLLSWAMLPLIALTDLLGEGDCLHLTAER